LVDPASVLCRVAAVVVLAGSAVGLGGSLQASRTTVATR